MEYLTRQEIFDKAVKGLASQGFNRSVDADNSCLYRGPDGKRCAIGWLIPDDKYHSNQENECARRYVEKYGDEIRCAVADATFCDELQEAHDLARAPAGVRQRLKRFAKRYKLGLPSELAG